MSQSFDLYKLVLQVLIENFWTWTCPNDLPIVIRTTNVANRVCFHGGRDDFMFRRRSNRK